MNAFPQNLEVLAENEASIALHPNRAAEQHTACDSLSN